MTLFSLSENDDNDDEDTNKQTVDMVDDMKRKRNVGVLKTLEHVINNFELVLVLKSVWLFCHLNAFPFSSCTKVFPSPSSDIYFIFVSFCIVYSLHFSLFHPIHISLLA
jgi:hypothetical protein